MLKAISLLLLFLNVGCSGIPFRGSDGTTHYFILGFGVVSVNNSKPDAAVITDVNAVGIAASDGPGLRLSVGACSCTMIAVPQDAKDVRVELKKRPGEIFLVEIQAAELFKSGGADDQKPR
jgi:hypothetical protein